jgi:hypothetical protein
VQLRSVVSGPERCASGSWPDGFADTGSGVGVTTRFVAVGVRAVDPLANKYNRLLEDAGLAPTIRTEAVDGEKLVERFGRDRFDIAYSRNALDHTADPWL